MRGFLNPNQLTNGINMFNNRTKNQHYISQVEQKLNSINPESSRNKRKIFEYELLDRELDTYQKTYPNGVKIEQNLSFNDLYTFEVLTNQTRNNFEIFFQKYENEIESLTINLIEKSKNNQPITEDEVFKLITCKFLNFLRNPFSIKKVINTFYQSLDYHPQEVFLAQEFNKLNKDNILIPQQYLDNLNISTDDYINWLKILFISLAVEMESESLTEKLIKATLDTNNRIVLMRLNIYDSEICLLSDRGYVDQSSLFKGSFCMSFNLTKNAFITIITLDNSITTLRSSNLGLNDHLDILETRGFTKMEVNRINLYVVKNDLEMLKAYNSNVKYQCNRNFYCSSDKFL